MTAAEIWKRVRPHIADLAAPVLLMVGPFWAFLHFHAYGLLRPESLLISGSLIVGGLLCGLLLVRTRSAVLRALIVTVLLVVAIDFQVPQADGHLGVLAVVLFAAAWVLRTHVTTLVSVTALVFFASNLVLGSRVSAGEESAPRVTNNVDLPPLFHFILDEHIGLDGIPLEIPGAAEAKAELIENYVGQGFRSYARAYSPYHLTVNAIPNLVNFARSDVHLNWLGGTQVRFAAVMSSNAYFEELHDAGYALRIYQPNIIDLCAGEVQPESCYTIPRNTIMHLPYLDMPLYPRMWFVVTYYAANTSYLYRKVREAYRGALRPLAGRWGLRLPEWYWVNSRINAAGAMDLLARIRSDLGEVESIRGTAFIAHLIHPHSPYLLDRDCSAHVRVRRRLEPLEEVATSSPEARQIRYQFYLLQARCLARQLREFFREVERAGGHDAVIVLHGDHGSRIGTVLPEPDARDSMSAADFADLYSSFVAIKAPGIDPGIDTTVVATHDLLRYVTATGFRKFAVPSDSAPIVFLFDAANRQLVPAPLPAFWHTFSSGSR